MPPVPEEDPFLLVDFVLAYFPPLPCIFPLLQIASTPPLIGSIQPIQSKRRIIARDAEKQP